MVNRVVDHNTLREVNIKMIVGDFAVECIIYGCGCCCGTAGGKKLYKKALNTYLCYSVSYSPFYNNVIESYYY